MNRKAGGTEGQLVLAVYHRDRFASWHCLTKRSRKSRVEVVLVFIWTAGLPVAICVRWLETRGQRLVGNCSKWRPEGHSGQMTGKTEKRRGPWAESVTRPVEKPIRQ
jgi:hypothetical protein